MRKALLNFCLLSIFLLPTVLYSQLPKLVVLSVTRTPGDTIFYNGPGVVLEYAAVFSNNGQGVLDGPVRMMVEYPLGTQEEERGLTSVVNFENGMMDTIRWTDTVNTLNGARYKGGDNILVIWPKSDQNAVAPDTFYHPVHIVDLTTDVQDKVELQARVELFPNPVRSALNFRFMKDKHKLEYVRIVDIQGKAMYFSDQSVEKLSMDAYRPGLYFVEIKYKDGLRGTYKVLVTD